MGIPEERSSVFSDLKDINSKLGWLAAFVALSTTGAQAFVMKAVEPYEDILDIVVLNVPMVASATVLAMLVMRRAHARTGFWQAFWTVVAAIVIPYAIAWLFGLAPGFDGLRTVYGECASWNVHCTPGSAVVLREPGAISLLSYLHPVRALGLAYHILTHYFAPDRLPNTISALAAGAFIAWVFEFKLLPRARRSEG